MVICDRRVPVRVMGKVYKRVVRLVLWYGFMEGRTDGKRVEVGGGRLEDAKIFRIMNDYIRGTAQIRRFGDSEETEIEMVSTCTAERGWVCRG